MTLWKLPDAIEEEFDARWEFWLDQASEWNSFFDRVAALGSTDLVKLLRNLDWLLMPSSTLMDESAGLPKGVLSLCLLFLVGQIQTFHCWHLASRAASRVLWRFPTQRDQTHDSALQSERCIVIHHH